MATFEEEFLKKNDPGRSRVNQSGTMDRRKSVRRVPPANTSLMKYNPFQMNNMLRTAGRFAGPAGGLLSAGIIANSLLSDDEPSLSENINTAEKGRAWVRRALNPDTETTANNETIRSMHGKHSKTGEWIVFPSIRSVGGKLTQLSEDEAQAQAEKLEDFIDFGSEVKALEFSKGLSEEIGKRRSRVTNRGLLNG